MQKILLLFSIVVFTTACSKKISFRPSSIVPAASGNVNISRDQNDNYDIRLQVDNLASPERLASSRDMYVVWMETEDTRTKNLGRLSSSKRLFSDAWRGELETVTPEKPVRVFITSEDTVTPRYPGRTVMTTETFDVD